MDDVNPSHQHLGSSVSHAHPGNGLVHDPGEGQLQLFVPGCAQADRHLGERVGGWGSCYPACISVIHMVGQCSDLSAFLGTHLKAAESSNCHVVLAPSLVCGGSGLADSLVVPQLVALPAGGCVCIAVGLPDSLLDLLPWPVRPQ